MNARGKTMNVRKREAAVNGFYFRLQYDGKKEEYRRKEREQDREYGKKGKLHNGLSSSSCLNTPQKRIMKAKISNLQKKDKKLSAPGNKLVITSTPISFGESGCYSSKSEDESATLISV